MPLRRFGETPSETITFPREELVEVIQVTTQYTAVYLAMCRRHVAHPGTPSDELRGLAGDLAGTNSTLLHLLDTFRGQEVELYLAGVRFACALALVEAALNAEAELSDLLEDLGRAYSQADAGIPGHAEEDALVTTWRQTLSQATDLAQRAADEWWPRAYRFIWSLEAS